MILTLEISPEVEETLRTIASREGVAPDRYVLDVLQERLVRDRDLLPHFPRGQAELLQRINGGCRRRRGRAITRSRRSEMPRR